MTYLTIYNMIYRENTQRCVALRYVATVELARAYSYSSRLPYEAAWSSFADECENLYQGPWHNLSFRVLLRERHSIDFYTDAHKRFYNKKTKRETISGV